MTELTALQGDMKLCIDETDPIKSTQNAMEAVEKLKLDGNYVLPKVLIGADFRIERTQEDLFLKTPTFNPIHDYVPFPSQVPRITSPCKHAIVKKQVDVFMNTKISSTSIVLLIGNKGSGKTFICSSLDHCLVLDARQAFERRSFTEKHQLMDRIEEELSFLPECTTLVVDHGSEIFQDAMIVLQNLCIISYSYVGSWRRRRMGSEAFSTSLCGPFGKDPATMYFYWKNTL